MCYNGVQEEEKGKVPFHVAVQQFNNERTRNLFMCEAASRIVLTTTLPPSMHRPASLLRRTMNLVIFWIKMMVVILTMTEVKLIIIMIWIRMMILIMTAR